ncbi:MAG: NHL repeat-containing protein [candidate division Zixibacteria bacterium]|nr:NHL repeat-containing protein [candidate division Zixibacteria bacterium]
MIKQTGRLLFAVILLALPVTAVHGQTEADLSVPAEYIRDLTLPGSNNHFLRPARITVDRSHQEIYVADVGNGRVLIFDDRGTLRFQFSTIAQCGSPIDLAVGPQGQIFVLGTVSDGRQVFVYDYDGLFLREINVGDSAAGAGSDIAGIAVDDANLVYALDQAGLRVICVRDDGTFVHQFPILADVDSTQRAELVFGSPTIVGDQLFLPVSSRGTVYRYSLQGDISGTIGHGGTGIGELNFPVAAAVADNGLIMVLDKHRFNVECFSPAGKFLGEFGGKGISPGWFFHPTWLTVDGQDQVYVGQIFKNKIQLCRIPAFIQRRLAEETVGQTPSGTNSPTDIAADHPAISQTVKADKVNKSQE